jgi:orotidine 5'-phosphate decarboxylase subfamily 2
MFATRCVERVAELTQAGRHLCIGLDTDLQRLPAAVATGRSPADRVVAFNSAIIDATCDVASAYKPNIAFYEALGADGFDALARTIKEARALAPGIPVIVDAKRGDIGSTNAGYVTAIFDELDLAAATHSAQHSGVAGTAHLIAIESQLVGQRQVQCRTSTRGERGGAVVGSGCWCGLPAGHVGMTSCEWFDTERQAGCSWAVHP